MQVTIPKGNMGYDQYTVPNDCISVKPTVNCHLSTVKPSFVALCFGIVTCTSSDNLSRKLAVYMHCMIRISFYGKLDILF